MTMSWKYAAMEIYGLLSDVRDTDAEEMNVRDYIITGNLYCETPPTLEHSFSGRVVANL